MCAKLYVYATYRHMNEEDWRQPWLSFLGCYPPIFFFFILRLSFSLAWSLPSRLDWLESLSPLRDLLALNFSSWLTSVCHHVNLFTWVLETGFHSSCSHFTDWVIYMVHPHPCCFGCLLLFCFDSDTVITPWNNMDLTLHRRKKEMFPFFVFPYSLLHAHNMPLELDHVLVVGERMRLRAHGNLLLLGYRGQDFTYTY